MMARVLLVLALVGLAAVPAHAQIAAAVGQPLPSADLDPGTVSVRAIAGSIGKPVVGTDVTLVVNGTPRVARTDDAGRVFFKDLPAGATVKASIVDEDKKKFESSEFQLGDQGVRLLLSTKPLEMGAGGAPFAGGAGGMPEPRQMSGRAPSKPTRRARSRCASRTTTSKTRSRPRTCRCCSPPIAPTMRSRFEPSTPTRTAARFFRGWTSKARPRTSRWPSCRATARSIA
jgi:hypothetical protein